MRTRRAVLLAWLAAATALAAGPAALAAGATPTSGSAYPWVQPWELQSTAVPSVGSWTQPPARIAIGAPATPGVPDTSYRWVQPWTVGSGFAPDVGHWTQPPLPAG
jgi:hypothetical protein